MMGSRNADRVLRLKALTQAAPGWIWTARCGDCGRMACLPVSQLLEKFGDVHPVHVAMLKVRCTGCNQTGQVTAKLARLCDPGCGRARG